MKTIIVVFAMLFALAIANRRYNLPAHNSVSKCVAVANAPLTMQMRHVVDERPYRQLHDYYATRFSQQKGFGFGRIMSTASQHNMLALGDTQQCETSRITRLELMGLSTIPVVYTKGSFSVADGRKFDGVIELPRMENARAGKTGTRNLNEFEQKAYQQLALGRDVVVEENGERAKVVGALRADQNCAKCHDVSKGTLLGALVYSVERVGR